MDNEVAAGAKNNASNGGRACKIGKPSGHSIFRRCVSLETFIIRFWKSINYEKDLILSTDSNAFVKLCKEVLVFQQQNQLLSKVDQPPANPTGPQSKAIIMPRSSTHPSYSEISSSTSLPRTNTNFHCNTSNSASQHCKVELRKVLTDVIAEDIRELRHRRYKSPQTSATASISSNSSSHSVTQATSHSNLEHKQNILSLGYRMKRHDSAYGLKSSPDIECFCVNTIHTIYSKLEWQTLCHRIGEELMKQLLATPMLMKVSPANNASSASNVCSNIPADIGHFRSRGFIQSGSWMQISGPAVCDVNREMTSAHSATGNFSTSGTEDSFSAFLQQRIRQLSVLEFQRKRILYNSVHPHHRHTLLSTDEGGRKSGEVNNSSSKVPYTTRCTRLLPKHHILEQLLFPQVLTASTDLSSIVTDVEKCGVFNSLVRALFGDVIDGYEASVGDMAMTMEDSSSNGGEEKCCGWPLKGNVLWKQMHDVSKGIFEAYAVVDVNIMLQIHCGSPDDKCSKGSKTNKEQKGIKELESNVAIANNDGDGLVSDVVVGKKRTRGCRSGRQVKLRKGIIDEQTARKQQKKCPAQNREKNPGRSNKSQPIANNKTGCKGNKEKYMDKKGNDSTFNGKNATLKVIGNAAAIGSPVMSPPYVPPTLLTVDEFYSVLSDDVRHDELQLGVVKELDAVEGGQMEAPAVMHAPSGTSTMECRKTLNNNGLKDNAMLLKRLCRREHDANGDIATTAASAPTLFVTAAKEGSNVSSSGRKKALITVGERLFQRSFRELRKRLRQFPERTRRRLLKCASKKTSTVPVSTGTILSNEIAPGAAVLDRHCVSGAYIDVYGDESEDGESSGEDKQLIYTKRFRTTLSDLGYITQVCMSDESDEDAGGPCNGGGAGNDSSSRRPAAHTVNVCEEAGGSTVTPMSWLLQPLKYSFLTDRAIAASSSSVNTSFPTPTTSLPQGDNHIDQISKCDSSMISHTNSNVYADGKILEKKGGAFHNYHVRNLPTEASQSTCNFTLEISQSSGFSNSTNSGILMRGSELDGDIDYSEGCGADAAVIIPITELLPGVEHVCEEDKEANTIIKDVSGTADSDGCIGGLTEGYIENPTSVNNDNGTTSTNMMEVVEILESNKDEYDSNSTMVHNVSSSKATVTSSSGCHSADPLLNHGDIPSASAVSPPPNDFISMATPTKAVAEFVKNVCRRVFSKKLIWGSNHNERLFMRGISGYLMLGKWETLTAGNRTIGMKIRDMPWLKVNTAPVMGDGGEIPPQTGGRKRKHTMCDGNKDAYLYATSNHLLQQTLLLQLMHWIYGHFIHPLLSSCFYITEAEGCGQELLFYRKSVWKVIVAHGRKQMAGHFVPVVLPAGSTNASVQLLPTVRFVPKKSSVRAITNLRTTQKSAGVTGTGTSAGGTTAMQRPTGIPFNTNGGFSSGNTYSNLLANGVVSNKVLYNSLHVLKHLYDEKPPQSSNGMDGGIALTGHGFGCFGMNEIFEKIKEYKQFQRSRQKEGVPPHTYYVATLDLEKCFDNVDTVALYNLVRQMLYPVDGGDDGSDDMMSLNQVGGDGGHAGSATNTSTSACRRPMGVAEEEEVNYTISKHTITRYIHSLERTVTRRMHTIHSNDARKPFIDTLRSLIAPKSGDTSSTASITPEVRKTKAHSYERDPIYTDQVIYPKITRKEVLELVRLHLFKHQVTFPGCTTGNTSPQSSRLASKSGSVMTQVKGIPQGSVLSSLLCNMYYGNVEQCVFGDDEQQKKLGLSDRSSVLVRLMDDYLMISSDVNCVNYFLQRAHLQLAPFGGGINPTKTRVNFDANSIELLGKKISLRNINANASASSVVTGGNGNGGENVMVWCGFELDTIKLEFHPNFSRLLERPLIFSFTVPINQMSLSLRRAIKSFIKTKCHCLVLDGVLNSYETILRNIYDLYYMAALRTTAYVKKLCFVQGLPQRGTVALQGCVYRSVLEGVAFGSRLMRTRGRSTVGDNAAYPWHVITNAQVREIGWKAFVAAFQSEGGPLVSQLARGLSSRM